MRTPVERDVQTIAIATALLMFATVFVICLASSWLFFAAVSDGASLEALMPTSAVVAAGAAAGNAIRRSRRG